MIRVPREVYATAGERITLPEGRYLARITDAIEADDKLTVRYQILGGDHPAFIGSLSIEEFHLTPKAIKRAAILFKRLGLVERGTPDDDMVFYPEELVGREIVFDIVHDVSDKGITKSQWTWDICWPSDDKRVADFVSTHRHQATTPPPRPAPQPVANGTSSPEYF